MKRAAVEVNQLTKVYPGSGKGGKPLAAVDRVSLAIEPGKILGLLGPNGAGKSTTISMLLGSLTPTSGQIKYFGLDFDTHQAEIKQQVTFASTYIRMPWRLTVLENLRVYGYLYGLSQTQFDARVKKFLSRFGVWDQRNKTMNSLSAGQVTRVMLAKAFIPHPKVVLLDEPTASLDPEMAHQIRGFVKEQQAEFGTSMLYTSHNMDEVADVCDRVMFLKRGRIVAADTPENLVKTLKDVTVRLTLIEPVVFRTDEFETLSPQIERQREKVKITVKETDVASLFELLAQEGVKYSQVSLDKPTLEDYFLRLSQ